MGAETDTVTVSGMSSGGFMATQMYVIYSELFQGAGIVAGGPYYCWQDGVPPKNEDLKYMIDKCTVDA